MRHAALCLVVLAVAACNGDGVSIEVHRGDTHATRVELYVVDGHCTTDEAGETPCPQLKTPSATKYLDGEVYTRKDASKLEAPVESDGVAYFTIRANGDQTRIPLAVAVGFDANGSRVGAALMPFEFYTTDNNRHIVTLETIVEDKVTGNPQGDGLRVETWYEEPIGCLALEVTSNGMSDRKFIVPADDLDCDGWLPPQECDSIWPDHGPNDDSSLPYTCVAEESTSGGLGKRCLLGDAPCIDGDGAPECRPVLTNGQQWCVPSALCDPICQSSSNPGCLYNALKHPLVPVLDHPAFVHCKVPAMPASGGNGYQICRANLASDIVETWSIPTTTACTGFGIGLVTPTSIGPFMPSRSSPVGPQNVIAAELSDPCKLTLLFAGAFPSTIALDNVIPDLALKLDLANSLSLVVPLIVSFEPMDETACMNADAICFLEDADPDAANIDESLSACARFAPL